MNASRLKLEPFLYAIAFLLALTVRLVGANHLPLTDREAELALQSLALARGQAVAVGPHPAYLALTTLMLYIFNATNWLVRFWPALAGSLLVLVPALLRKRMGHLPAVLLAFFLALDPGMLAISRQAGSYALAPLFVLLAVGLWLNGRAALAGIAGGLALISGPSTWPGMIGLALALWTAGIRWPVSESQPVDADIADDQANVQLLPPASAEAADAAPAASWPNVAHTRTLLFALGTAVLVGTLFFTIPDGISAIGGSVAAYFGGWVPGDPKTGLPVGLFLLALVLYEFLPLVFGLWGGISGSIVGSASQKAVDRFLLAWFVIALVLAIAYPSRQPADLVWPLLPLWGLAARQMARLLLAPSYDRLPALGQAVLVLIILVFVAMAVFAVVNNPGTANPIEARVRLFGAVAMLVATGGLIAWGWSRFVALRGLAWAAGAFLLVYFVASGWNATGLAGREGDELWSSGPRLRSNDLMLATIANVTQWGPQVAGGPDVVVVGIPSPALRWALRDIQRVSFTDQLPASASPAVVITPDQPELAMAASYRGERFLFNEQVNWSLFEPSSWLRYLAFRTIAGDAVQQNRVILWARTDLFPGGVLQPGKPSDAALPVNNPAR